MASHAKGRPLPKFGEWDVNNPASADGFTVIFAKARDEKKATGTIATATLSQTVSQPSDSHEYSEKFGDEFCHFDAEKVALLFLNVCAYIEATDWETRHLMETVKLAGRKL